MGVAGGKAGQNSAASSHGLDCSTGEVVALYTDKIYSQPQYIDSDYTEKLTIQISMNSISCALLLSRCKILVQFLNPVELFHQLLVHLLWKIRSLTKLHVTQDSIIWKIRRCKKF